MLKSDRVVRDMHERPGDETMIRKAHHRNDEHHGPDRSALRMTFPRIDVVIFVGLGLLIIGYLTERERRPAKRRATATVAAMAGPIRSVAISSDGRIVAALGLHHLR